jgi:hypothetical protein
LILIFVLDLFVGKTMRRNNAFACSSRGRTIIPTEAAIEGAASRRGNDNGARGSRGGRWAASIRGNDNGARGSRGGRGTATAPRGGRGAAATTSRGRGTAATPRGGRARRLEFISEEDVLQQSQVLES